MPGLRSSISELILSVCIWSEISEDEAPPTPRADGWLRPHRIDIVDTRHVRLINPWKLGTKYFVTSRSSDEEQFRSLLDELAEAEHVALGTILLGDDAISVMLRPAGTTFELFPSLTLPKSPKSLPLGDLRIATIHAAPIAMANLAGKPPAHEPRAERFVSCEGAPK